ncbi:glutamine-hydrolyzing GMP synthase [Ureaplasma zalophigenitalium]|uniref:GMP synthase [glutamine-hydrolyzing] n=1 Tax=Ureaplasma zalophigenitalium TaxID=907723 RepID=A0ABT3BNV9_9BACT|nr:glutamine-hydrolyzing GMP synthase [Ureaplasma zalophigenitalium]MCV3753953.1 glutamine-hydrolyzing GMP synthase [Ureaplasma zalophigenitalium]
MHKILVIDFGSQYNQLLVRRIRELGVYSELIDRDDVQKYFHDKNVLGFILSGGPHSVYEKDAMTIDPEIFKLKKPVLGVCYGMQLMMHLLGGQVAQAECAEYGHTEISVKESSHIAGNLEKTQKVWMSHADRVISLAPNFQTYATSLDCPHVIVENQQAHLYGIQYHCEVNNTPNGHDMLANFVYNICQAKKEWTMNDFIDQQITAIKEEVQDNQVICALSGGVDSMVTASLIKQAVGDQLTCVFVDHGLLRKNEKENVLEIFSKQFGKGLVYVDASKDFLEALKGVSEPEQKRKIIGAMFIEIFKREAQKIKNVKFLAQGTLYTDIIESGTKNAVTIKSHHNVGGLPKDLGFSLIEPLKTLFKDEVRVLGKILGLNDAFINRKPFPGPGLAIRVIGDITEEKLFLVRESDAIFREELEKAGLDQDIWQFFTVLLNNKSVGVMGDQRTYAYTLALRAVNSIDGMTADFAHIPFEVLAKTATRIVNEIKGINRVVYDITSKPPGTIEWE